MSLAEHFDAVIEVVSPFDEQGASEIPAKRGVVLLESAEGSPVVLLTAADMRSRVRNRLAEPEEDDKLHKLDLRAVTARVRYRLTHNAFETDLEYLRAVVDVFPARFVHMTAWKAPWFIHVDVDSPQPRFTVSRKIFGDAGRYFGPFMTARDAEKFIENLCDVFLLCRDARCLRGDGVSSCNWAEMGKCVGVGVGKISMADYRVLLGEVCDFVAGKRQKTVDALTAEMKTAAAELKFEKAAIIKRRIERVTECDKPAYRFVKAAEDFRYIFVQNGGGKKRCLVFFVNVGEIHGPFELKCPLEPEKVGEMLKNIKKIPVFSGKVDAAGRLVMGLATRGLFSDPGGCGLVVEFDGAITADGLVEKINAAADVLKISTPKAPQNSEPSTSKCSK